MVDVFHVNLGKRTNACHILAKNLVKHRNAIISINELPNNFAFITGLTSIFFCRLDSRNTRAAVCIKGDQYKGILLEHLSSPDVAVVNVTGCDSRFTVISAYLPPYDNEYQKHLSELQFAISNLGSEEKIIVCTDSNARNTLWNDVDTNRRGNEFETFVFTNELVILNNNGPFTYNSDLLQRPDLNQKTKKVSTSRSQYGENERSAKDGKSTIDLILANYKMMDFEIKTEVLDIYTGSDHRMIQTAIKIRASPAGHNPFRNTTRIYRTDKADWLAFENTLALNSYKLEETDFEVSSHEEADLALQTINDYLKDACEAAIPKLKHNSNREPNQNDEIDSLTRQEYSLARRLRKLEIKNVFLASKVAKELAVVQKNKTAALAAHRKKCFEEACFSASSPAEAYKLHKNLKAKLMKSCPATIMGSDGLPTKNSHDTTELLFKHSFPDKGHPKPQDYLPDLEAGGLTPITTAEVEQIVRWMQNNKAPGIDGFSPIIVKKSLHHIIGPIVTLFNALLRIQYFPKKWKEGFAIFIPKQNANKGMKTVKDFRPITLLNVLAKIFEKLIIIRINKHMYSTNKINTNQEGFRHQRGTANALHSFRNFVLKNRERNRSTVAIFLDISGAFDNACWQLIISSLSKNGCPRYLINLVISYFKDREVTTNSQNTKLSKKLTQGCPQGSCCGPSLWNILLNNLFDINEIKNKIGCDDFFIKAFADDIALAFAFRDGPTERSHTEKKIKATLDAIYVWGGNSLLSFNINKTQAILFKSKLSSTAIKVMMNKQEIKLESKVKYLGIWFDSELRFEDHANKTVDKCKTIFNIMRCYSGRMWGLSPALTRLIYRTVITPVLTYGASVWYTALANEKACKKIRTLQYNCCKSITQAFRTCPILGTNLLSNTMPLVYEIVMRSQIELSRITGNFSAHVFENQLVDPKTYKPNRELFTSGYILSNFSGEANAIDTTRKDADLVGDPYRLSVEPRVRWADLSIGTNQAKIEITSYNSDDRSHDFYIYTDGSKIGNYGTGCGFIITTNTSTLYEVMIPMHPLCSVSQAEILAILNGLLVLNCLCEIDNRKVLICTDSECALYRLLNLFSDNLIRFQIDQLLSTINKRHAKVSFAKVKAHSGVQGNEDADRCARLASSISANWDSQPGSEAFPPQFSYLPLSIIKLMIKNQFKRAWTTRPFDKEFNDDRANLSDWMLNFIPNSKSISDKLVALCDFHTTQIITRHGENMEYFSKFGISNSNKCVCHREDADTPEHILFHCDYRYTITLKEMGITRKQDLHKVLANNESIAKFKELCKTIVNDRKELIKKRLPEAAEQKPVGKQGKITRKITKTGKSTSASSENPFYRVDQEHDYHSKGLSPTIIWIAMDGRVFSHPIKNCKNPKKGTAMPAPKAPEGEPRLKAAKTPKINGLNAAMIDSFRNDGNIPTAYPVIGKEKRSNKTISWKHGITASSWLSDWQILEYAQKIQTGTNKANYLVIDPVLFVSDSMLVDHLKSSITQDTKFIIAIIHSNGNHWITGLINLDSKTIALVDSLGETNHGTLFNKLYRLADISLSLQKKRHTFREFTFNCSLDNPKQENLDDCGLFVCKLISMIFKKDNNQFAIRTGEFRDELAKVLDTENPTRDSGTSHRKRDPDRLNKFKQSSYINRLNRLQIAVKIIKYTDLVTDYFSS